MKILNKRDQRLKGPHEQPFFPNNTTELRCVTPSDTVFPNAELLAPLICSKHARETRYTQINTHPPCQMSLAQLLGCSQVGREDDGAPKCLPRTPVSNVTAALHER